jgi:hypothetical protein
VKLGIGFLNKGDPSLINTFATSEDRFATLTRYSIIDDNIDPFKVFEESEYVDAL